MDKLSRRDLATLSGALALAATSSRLQAAPQDPPAPSSDLLAERKARIARASEDLRTFELKYADEPIFRLVIR